MLNIVNTTVFSSLPLQPKTVISNSGKMLALDVPQE